jgi:integrase
MTGMREQEVMHVYWSDVNFAASTVRVRHKPDRGWTPKAYKEREIPIPSKLVKKFFFKSIWFELAVCHAQVESGRALSLPQT